MGGTPLLIPFKTLSLTHSLNMSDVISFLICRLPLRLHILHHMDLVHDIMSDLIIFALGIRVLPHHVQRLLEQVVHTLNGPAFEFRQTEVYEDHARIGEHGVHKEDAPAHLINHCRGGVGGAVIYDPAVRRRRS